MTSSYRLGRGWRQFLEQRANSPVDLVADLPDLFDGPADRVGEVPVQVPFPRIDGTRVPATHGDHRVGVPNDLVGKGLGELPGDVDPDLAHRLDHERVDLAGRRAAGRPDVGPTSRVMIEERRGHLASTGVVDADEQDLGDLLHALDILTVVSMAVN